jgi:hypothetical protein
MPEVNLDPIAPLWYGSGTSFVPVLHQPAVAASAGPHAG